MLPGDEKMKLYLKIECQFFSDKLLKVACLNSFCVNKIIRPLDTKRNIFKCYFSFSSDKVFFIRLCNSASHDGFNFETFFHKNL
jgi:hypothetical protein